MAARTASRGRVPPVRGGVDYWDAERGEWRRGTGHGRSEPTTGPRTFSPPSVLQQTGFRAREEARASARVAGDAASGFGEASGISGLGIGGFLVAAGASVLGLALLDTALRGRGPAAVEKLLGVGGGGIGKLFAADDPLFGYTAPTPTQPVAVTPSAGSSEHPDSRTPYKVIGRPGEGTHSTTSEPDNWQSDHAYDLATRYGTPIYAPEAGTLGNTGYLGSPSDTGRFAGQRINLTGARDSHYFAHLSGLAPGIVAGAHVKAGQLLGYSGRANGVDHLHYATLKSDPIAWLRLIFRI